MAAPAATHGDHACPRHCGIVFRNGKLECKLLHHKDCAHVRFMHLGGRDFEPCTTNGANEI